jgi:hypothetical protein
MALLQDILDANLNYHTDICVTLDYGDRTGRVTTEFIYRIFDKKTYWAGKPAFEHQSMAQVNAALIGYRLLDRTSETEPFYPRWDYRQKRPEWSVFREMCLVYYKEVKDVHLAFSQIIDDLTQSFELSEALYRAFNWYKSTKGTPDNEKYMKFHHMLVDYRDMMGL